MHQNVEPLHATNGMFDEDTNLTQGPILSLLLRGQFRIGIRLALSGFLVGNLNEIALVVRLNPLYIPSLPRLRGRQTNRHPAATPV